MRKQLEAIDGVSSVEVDYSKKTATCQIEQGADMAAVKDAVKAGLKAPFSFGGFQ